MTTKQFKVADIGPRPNMQGLFPHLLVAQDAETWEVHRNLYMDEPKCWERKQIIDVPLKDGMPDWAALRCEGPKKHQPRYPFHLVKRVWGAAIAGANDVPSCREPKPLLVNSGIVFEASHFEPSPQHTAEGKADLANKLVAFMSSGFRRERFSIALYEMLIGWCEFDLFDKSGCSDFFVNHCASAAKRLSFIERIADALPAGDPSDSTADVQQAIRAWVVQVVLPKVKKTAKTVVVMRERQMLRTLLLKYGMPEDLKLPGQ